MSPELHRFIREIPDFPKPGIGFKDITPLLRDPAAFGALIHAMADRCRAEGLRPDLIASPEARGFVPGAALAFELEVGFVPIRKPGKLPAATSAVEYELEYGTDRVEMHVDAIGEGQRVLLVDDLLATGGTIRACAQLVEKGGGIVDGCLFAVELTFLSGRKKLAGWPVFSIIRY
jgi:adenine phosphoribosyltransferase